MKGVGAMATAAAATGLLGGCGATGDVYDDANGLNSVAQLKGIKMTVRSLSYANYSDGTYYIAPEVLIKNDSAAGVPLNPTGGSFEVYINGTNKLDITADSMARLKKSNSMNAIEARTLSRGQQEKGYICAKGSNATKFNYVYVIFYPNANDKHTYLRCKIDANKATAMLG